jgi:hypothetical protein
MRLHEVSTNVWYASFQIFHVPQCQFITRRPSVLQPRKTYLVIAKCTAHLTALRWNKKLQGKMGCQLIQALTNLTNVRLIRMRKAYLAWRLAWAWSADLAWRWCLFRWEGLSDWFDVHTK